MKNFLEFFKYLIEGKGSRYFEKKKKVISHATLKKSFLSVIFIKCLTRTLKKQSFLQTFPFCHLPVFLRGKSESYLTIADGGCGILYGCELVALAPAGNDSPDELLTTPLSRLKVSLRNYCRSFDIFDLQISIPRWILTFLLFDFLLYQKRLKENEDFFLIYQRLSSLFNHFFLPSAFALHRD